MKSWMTVHLQRLIRCLTNYTFLVRKENEKFISKSNEEIILSLFYIILDELHKMEAVPAIDIRAYAETTINLFIE